jgi:hypothetical protein
MSAPAWELAKGGRSINIGPGGRDGKIRMEPGPDVQETLRRIVAMAKHCEGFPTEVLESGPSISELVADWKPELPDREGLSVRSDVDDAGAPRG